jgi:hypothetical protein
VSTLLKAFGLDVQRHVKVSKVVKCNEKWFLGQTLIKTNCILY